MADYGHLIVELSRKQQIPALVALLHFYLRSVILSWDLIFGCFRLIGNLTDFSTCFKKPKLNL